MARKKKLAVVIDDDVNLVDSLDTTLGMNNFDVIKVVNYKEIPLLLDKGDPSYIFVDLNMPRLDSLAFLADINSRFPTVSVIAMTGNLSKFGEGLEQLIQKGLLNKVLEKPFTSSDFELLLNQLENKSYEVETVGRGNILLVDDEVEITELLSEVFEKRGFNCYVANSAKEALRLYDEMRPECVLVDIILVDKNGFWLINEIKALNPDVVIVAMTAQDHQEFRDRLKKETGERKYLSKPFSLDSLNQLARSLEREIKK